MKITDVKLYRISIPLRVPFKTALRSVDSVEDVIVEIITDTGERGFGEAPPTGVITGDTTGAIVGAIRDHIGKSIIGMDIDALEDVLQTIQRCIVHNTSAKAAVDMAVWDLYGKLYGVPVHKLLGGARKEITTDITISVNPPEQMAADTRDAIRRGYDCLKVKVGVSPELDVARLSAVREAAGDDVLIRIDANQAWTPKQAVRILNEMQEKGLKIELVEQPVKAADIEGLKYVTERSYVPVLADESVFSPEDALRIMQMHAADYINIKLMKCGGLYNAWSACWAACSRARCPSTRRSSLPAQRKSSQRSISTAPSFAGRIRCTAAPYSTKRPSRSPMPPEWASKASKTAGFSQSERPAAFYSVSRVRFLSHLYFLKRSMTHGILPTSSRQVQA